MLSVMTMRIRFLQFKNSFGYFSCIYLFSRLPLSGNTQQKVPSMVAQSIIAKPLTNENVLQIEI